jgi:hypothetical protein
VSVNPAIIAILQPKLPTLAIFRYGADNELSRLYLGLPTPDCRAKQDEARSVVGHARGPGFGTADQVEEALVA